jgi:hypothetical protein
MINKDILFKKTDFQFKSIIENNKISSCQETILYNTIMTILLIVHDELTLVDLFSFLSKIIDRYYVYLYKNKILLYLYLIKFYFDETLYEFKVSDTSIIVLDKKDVVFEFYFNSGDVNYKQIYKFNINNNSV